jgi:protein-L-isoaspartate(D-aspartate) O-methyltransferase
MIDYAQARRAMVDNQLRTSGITDRRVLAAMGLVARETFVPERRRPLAYIDDAQPLGGGRFLPAPAPFAKMVQLAQVRQIDTVLDLGAGTGYSAAVLAQLAAKVVAVEPDQHLAAEARTALQDAAGDIEVVEGPVEQGAPEAGPYDVIVLEGAVAAVPEALFQQLKEGGRLVALITRGPTSTAHLFVRAGKDVTSRAEFDASLPPLIAPATTSSEFEF